MKYLSKLKKLADLYFETSSDIGGVAVGNEPFVVLEKWSDMND